MSDQLPMQQQSRRVIIFLGKQGAELETTATGKVMLRSERGVIAVAASVVAGLIEQGLVARDGASIGLTEAGKMARRDQAEGLGTQPRELGQTNMQTEDGWESVTINLAESPLAQIARRRGRDGRAYLSEAELRAGERLRSDFTRGQLMPKLGATWQALAGSSGRGSGGAGGAVDLTDAALAARQRVEKAVDATGPELSGVLLDICCFLKGLEQVEAERGWPVRSGKVMLKAALGALARHYEPARQSGTRPRSFHWGAEDYRPVIG
ncbi:hypothetical protein JYU29_04100 [Tianweitania sp. BSSL-BM11]|uniref:DUF6456 domain-containing protein n=1 Tax=Tianweitania aestuarii TaxID=2814886 RepID=A0ABS5RU62_9HYPH|nr:DUF6456 domain-containing protein [Tianweitania aestuarii]MBS9719867.1 hypothetical protein [Tianweitania aestuarii]